MSSCMVGAVTLRSSSPCSSADLGCPWEDTLFSECLSLPAIGEKRAEKFAFLESFSIVSSLLRPTPSRCWYAELRPW